MENKKQNRIILIAVFALAIGLSFQSFLSSSPIKVSKGSFEELEKLNHKYQAIEIENLIDPNKEKASNLFASTIKTEERKEIKTDKQLLFKLKNGSENIEDLFVIKLPPGTKNLEKIARDYENNVSDFEFVEVDQELKLENEITDTTSIEENHDFETLSLNGSQNENTYRYQIERRYMPATGVTVAVIDTGTDIFHQDIRNHRWSNTNEIYRNDKDDDYNSFTDDKYGWNFIENGYNSYEDKEGHGTHIGGIISKDTNSRIMPVKVIEAKKGNLSNVIKGIKYAVENNADIINFSIGTTKESRSLEAAIKYAASKNVILVAAAGNSGDSTKYYPAAYGEVMGVGANDKYGYRLKKSNYGPWVDIYAPGKQIRSTLPNNEYGYKSGTSQAAAFISNKVAKIKEKQPFISNKLILLELKKESF